jgi:hypothetical protein
MVTLLVLFENAYVSNIQKDGVLTKTQVTDNGPIIYLNENNITTSK